MSNDQLKRKIKQLVLEAGGDLCGVADLEDISDALVNEYGQFVKKYKRAIAIAVFFPREVIAQLKEGPTYTYRYYYETLNRKLDDLALMVNNYLESKEYASFPIPASDYVVKLNSENKYVEELKGIFSHRLAAQKAGLGWIGKSCHLVNPQVGPRLRLVTVLTDAYMEPDKPIENQCGECSLCVKTCPPRAIKGVLHRAEDPIETRFNATACEGYLAHVGKVFGKRVCGLCLVACPWGTETCNGNNKHASKI